eukprot:TRINITY_DN9566_c0_g1_i10.p2 TRINITY_DN9566_c0_g1~~TRINITY_DN9566_c0_g1_i10.p2  ORF type:complete len:164 (+),score=36.91 TRINITY_DN9566_c0_g1_i10:183-674(+)
MSIICAKLPFVVSERALPGSSLKSSQLRKNVIVSAGDRQMWLVGATPPVHLDGSLAGDFGFDPLGLGTEPDRFKWYVEAEKTNGRWAMMAVAGIMGQELLGVTPKWFEAGAKDYGIPFLPLLAIEAVIMGFLETKRYQGFKETGSSGFFKKGFCKVQVSVCYL